MLTSKTLFLNKSGADKLQKKGRKELKSHKSAWQMVQFNRYQQEQFVCGN